MSPARPGGKRSAATVLTVCCRLNRAKLACAHAIARGFKSVATMWPKPRLASSAPGPLCRYRYPRPYEAGSPLEAGALVRRAQDIRCEWVQTRHRCGGWLRPGLQRRVFCVATHWHQWARVALVALPSSVVWSCRKRGDTRRAHRGRAVMELFNPRSGGDKQHAQRPGPLSAGLAHAMKAGGTLEGQGV